MYTNPVLFLKKNGYLSSEISMKRGIRQGCPVSALLLILVVEMLAIKIKQNTSIRGLEVAFGQKKRCIKISQYADDCTILLKNKDSITDSKFDFSLIWLDWN